MSLQIVDWLTVVVARVVVSVISSMRVVIIMIVLTVVVDLEWGHLSTDVVGWLNEVGSVGVEVSVVAIVNQVIIHVLITVVVGANWLVVVEGGLVVPVDVSSVPCVVVSLLNWLLNEESSVVLVVISVVSSVWEWDRSDLSTVVWVVLIKTIVSMVLIVE